jgi:hypothetical protein
MSLFYLVIIMNMPTETACLINRRAINQLLKHSNQALAVRVST